MKKFDSKGNVIEKEQDQEKKQKLNICVLCGKICGKVETFVKGTTKGDVCGQCYCELLRKK